MNEVIANAYSKDGKLIVRNRKQFDKDVSELDGELEVVVRKKKKVRSIPANRYWFGVIVEMIWRRLVDLGNDVTKADVHAFLKHRFHYKEFLDEKSGEIMHIPLSTTTMSGTEFSLLFEKAWEFGATVLDIYIPRPNEQAALGLLQQPNRRVMQDLFSQPAQQFTDAEVQEIAKKYRQHIAQSEAIIKEGDVTWSAVVHKIENNEESQQNLNSKRKVFGGQCKAVYDWLMAGHTITVEQSINKVTGSKISSLPALKDLRAAGFRHSDIWNEARTEKIFFMSATDIEHNNSKQ